MICGICEKLLDTHFNLKMISCLDCKYEFVIPINSKQHFNDNISGFVYEYVFENNIKIYKPSFSNQLMIKDYWKIRKKLKGFL